MPKSQKKSSQPRKKRSILFYITRYFLFFSVALLFFSGTALFLQKSQQVPTCANSKTCTSDLTEHIDNNLAGTFEGRTVIPPTISPDQSLAQAPVLGAQTEPGDKHIFVDLAKQTLYAYQGTTLVLKTLVSTGKWGKTPTGNFHIWEKLRATRMAGGEGADAYDLPNVPWTMYFYHDFGLHGAYWHDNFGHTMSHGCVNMRQVDAKALFQWADGPVGNTPGTAVSICDQITGDNQCIQNNPVN